MLGGNSMIYYDMWALRTNEKPNEDFWDGKKENNKYIVSKDKILESTFPDVIPNNFNSIDKKFDCIGIGSQIGQSKTLGNLLFKNILSKKEKEQALRNQNIIKNNVINNKDVIIIDLYKEDNINTLINKYNDPEKIENKKKEQQRIRKEKEILKTQEEAAEEASAEEAPVEEAPVEEAPAEEEETKDIDKKDQ